MNSTALKEAVATGYPREKMYGVWWAGAEPDVKDVGRRRQGLQRADAAARRRAEPKVDPGHPEVRARQGPGHRPKEEVGQVLYIRGLIIAMLGVEAMRTRAGALRQGQGDDRRAGALGPREPDARPDEARRAGLRRRDAADQDVVRRPHGRRLGARPAPGTARSGTSSPTGYAGRRHDHQADGQGRRRRSTRREEAHAARLLPRRADRSA